MADVTRTEIRLRFNTHDALKFCERGLNLTLEWLSASNLLGLIKWRHREQMPTAERFSILFSRLCLQTRCAVVKQTNKQSRLCNNKWFSDVGSSRKAAMWGCETAFKDVKWRVTWKNLWCYYGKAPIQQHNKVFPLYLLSTLKVHGILYIIYILLVFHTNSKIPFTPQCGNGLYDALI